MTSTELSVKELPTWQQELSNLLTDPAELIASLKLESHWLEPAVKAAQLFPLRVTRSYLDRIQPGQINDPLLRQILPLDAEFAHSEAYSADPLGEEEANKAPGLIHKYHGRVLLIAAPQCAINCRYCFRRHFDYKRNTPGRQQWHQSINYIGNHPSIEEVILSGGDPLVVSDKLLGWLIQQLQNIPHVQRLRIHSRLPIVLPQRLTPTLISLLTQSRLECVLVVHCNHPQEINSEVTETLLALRKAGITTLNQSVLLRGINDNSEALIRLSKQLFTCGVLPYYLHQLDKVLGVAHFEVSDNKAKLLYRSLLENLPGYLVPKLVKEVKGERHKLPLSL